MSKTLSQYISFGDPNVINALIRYRSKIDHYYTFDHEHTEALINICISEAEQVLNKKLTINDTNEFLPMGITDPFNEDLICTYIDLDNLIQESSLTKKQYIIVGLMMSGFKAPEIALYLNSRADTINKIVNNVSKKIANEYKRKWKYKIADEGLIKVRWNYKKCSKCKEMKPATRDFFGKDDRNNDGYKSVCLTCDNYTKKGG